MKEIIENLKEKSILELLEEKIQETIELENKAFMKDDLTEFHYYQGMRNRYQRAYQIIKGECK